MKYMLENLNCNLFLRTSDSELTNFCREVFLILGKHPEIRNAILADQDRLGLEKKLMRLEDHKYEMDKNPDLPGLERVEEVASPEFLILENGRPRMTPEIVFLFLCLRGYYGSVTDRLAVERFADSMTLFVVFSNMGMKMPKPTTILENLNCLSGETRSLVLQCQLEDALEDGLDDFSYALFDSTSVEASSCWPTDAGVILRLLERVVAISSNLEKSGVPSIPAFYLPVWLRKLKKLLFDINNARGTNKCSKKKKLRRLYKQFLETASKAHEYLLAQLEKRSSVAASLDLSPSLRKALNALLDSMEDDLLAAASVIYYADERIFNDVVLPSAEKILSISDTTAAFIKKGQRNPVIGYKPQLARSANGFVTALIVEKGNSSDSANLFPLVLKHAENTGVVPRFVSADDGYSSGSGRLACLEYGVRDVCLSGAVGKKITPDELWESPEYILGRKKRSAVESLMFTLKYVFEFGRLRRRGLENAVAEMTEEVIAYNIHRSLLLKRRRQKEKVLKSA